MRCGVGVSCGGVADFHIRKVIWWGAWWGPCGVDVGSMWGPYGSEQRWVGSTEVVWGGLGKSGVWGVSGDEWDVPVSIFR